MVLELQPKSYDAPLLIGDMAEEHERHVEAKYWYERSLSNKPDYAEAKNRLERIDSLIHAETMGVGRRKRSRRSAGAEGEDRGGPDKEDYRFYKSKVKFDDGDRA